VKTFNFRPKKHRGAFSFKTRISNLGIESDDVDLDGLEDLIDDAAEAGELDEDDPDNAGDDDLDAGEVVDLLIYSVVGDASSLDPSDESNVTARAIATALRAAPNAKRINVHLNSEGGNVADALAIYNNLTDHKAEVRTFVDGLALSSASIIAMGGDSVTMRRGALMMIHNPWSLAIGDGNAMRKQAKTLDKFQAAIASVYAEKTGLSPAEIKSMMDEETWMTAMQAKRMGFADAVRGRVSAKQVAGTNNLKIGGTVYNLSKYKNGPAALRLEGNLPIGQKKIDGLKDDKEAVQNHMVEVARTALGNKFDHNTSGGSSLPEAARTAELKNDREAIHNRMTEVAKAALGKQFDQHKTGNFRDEKEALQDGMARIAKAALG
jgi:ATP-dependent protease ClpP protease subunit